MSSNFPYWKLTLPPFSEMFKNLRESDPVCSLGEKPGEWVINTSYPAGHRKVDGISNHFTEEVRIDASFSGGSTPRETYHEMLARLDSNGGLAAFHRYTAEHKREKIYAAGRECNTFNPTFAKWIYSRLGGKEPCILDLSAGWGDRAIAAAAMGAKLYHGCDPNPYLSGSYQELTEELKKHSTTEVILAIEPAEDFVPPLAATKSSYDVCVLSPPFYTLESYVDPSLPESATQSIERYGTYKEWRESFLLAYYRKAYECLREGGWLVVYITDVYAPGQEGDEESGKNKAPRKKKGPSKTKFPLLEDTRVILQGLGALCAEKHGLCVKSTSSFSGRGAPKVRWAEAWFKPARFSKVPPNTHIPPHWRMVDVPEQLCAPVDQGAVKNTYIVRKDKVASRGVVAVLSSTLAPKLPSSAAVVASPNDPFLVKIVSAHYACSLLEEGPQTLERVKVVTHGPALDSLHLSQARAMGAKVEVLDKGAWQKFEVPEEQRATTLLYRAPDLCDSSGQGSAEFCKDWTAYFKQTRLKPSRVWLYCATKHAVISARRNWGALGVRSLIMPATGFNEEAGPKMGDEDTLGEGGPADLWEMFRIAAHPGDVLIWEG